MQVGILVVWVATCQSQSRKPIALLFHVHAAETALLLAQARHN